MSDTPAPGPSPSVFQPKSDNTFFLGLGTLGGFYLFLILALILALVIVPRWEKSDAAKLERMAPPLKAAVDHMEIAEGKAEGTKLAADIKLAIGDIRQLAEFKQVKQVSSGALSMANSKLGKLLKKAKRTKLLIIQLTNTLKNYLRQHHSNSLKSVLIYYL